MIRALTSFEKRHSADQDCSDCCQRGYSAGVKNFYRNASKRDLADVALREHREEYEKKHRNATLAFLLGVPFADGISRALHNPGSLSKKLSSFSVGALGWGLAFATIFSYFGVNKALTRGSETLSEFKKEHPVMKFAADIGVGIAALYGASYGIEKADEKIRKDFPEFAKKLKSWSNSTAKFIDESFASKNIFEPMRNKAASWMNKNYNAADNIKAVSRWAVPAIMVGVVMKYVLNAIDYKNDVKSTFADLRKEQIALAKEEAANRVNPEEAEE